MLVYQRVYRTISSDLCVKHTLRLQTPSHPVIMQLANWFSGWTIPQKYAHSYPIESEFPMESPIVDDLWSAWDASPNVSQAEDQVLIRGAKFQGDCAQNSVIDCIKWGNIGHDIVVITSKLN